MEPILPSPAASLFRLLLLLTMLLAFVLPPSMLRPPADDDGPSEPALLPALLTALLDTPLPLGSLNPAAASAAARPASAATRGTHALSTTTWWHARHSAAAPLVPTWVLHVQSPQLRQHAPHHQPQLAQLHVSFQFGRIRHASLAVRPACRRRLLSVRAAAAAVATAAWPRLAAAGRPLRCHADVCGQQLLRVLHCLEGACLFLLLLVQLPLRLSLQACRPQVPACVEHCA